MKISIQKENVKNKYLPTDILHNTNVWLGGAVVGTVLGYLVLGSWPHRLSSGQSYRNTPARGPDFLQPLKLPLLSCLPEHPSAILPITID